MDTQIWISRNDQINIAAWGRNVLDISKELLEDERPIQGVLHSWEEEVPTYLTGTLVTNKRVLTLDIKKMTSKEGYRDIRTRVLIGRNLPEEIYINDVQMSPCGEYMAHLRHGRLTIIKISSAEIVYRYINSDISMEWQEGTLLITMVPPKGKLRISVEDLFKLPYRLAYHS